MTNVALIDIDYDEGDQGTYRATMLSIASKYIIEYSTGDIETDFANALSCARDTGFEIYFLSSCDHFIQDGDKYEWSLREDGTRITKTPSDFVLKQPFTPIVKKQCVD